MKRNLMNVQPTRTLGLNFRTPSKGKPYTNWLEAMFAVPTNDPSVLATSGGRIEKGKRSVHFFLAEQEEEEEEEEEEEVRTQLRQ
ncbi:hypothetical protein M0804_007927 [Polistes exclamans]|nr:hypothetical protein M0804_007927 [Polistes exclamans]